MSYIAFLLGLLLQGDKSVQLVVLCAEKPSVSLLKRVATELPVQLKQISEDHQYTVTLEPDNAAVLVSDDNITVKVFLTSPLLRDPHQQGMCFANILHLASTIHSKWILPQYQRQQQNGEKCSNKIEANPNRSKVE